MMSATFLKEESGFTVVEMLVAIVLSSIIIGIAWQGYRGFQQVNLNWRRRAALQEPARIILNGLVARLRYARAILDYDETSLVFLDRFATRKKVTARNGQIFIDGHPMIARDAVKAHLRFTFFSDDAEVNPVFADEKIADKIKMVIIISNPKGEKFNLETIVHLRNNQSHSAEFSSAVW